MSERPDPLDRGLVEEFVGVSHGDLDRVKVLLAEHPKLVTASWDWGAGDWESGLEAAAHIGRRDIALHLLDNGARLGLPAAAMLGYLDLVRSAIEAHPGSANIAGAHGIPLIAHAEAGGEEAAEVLAYLASL